MIKKSIQKILDFYLYSSLHIAIAATLLIFQTYLLIEIKVDYNYLIFIFSSTLFLYLLHNILGLSTLLKECVREKIEKMRQMKSILMAMLLISGICSVYSFFLLPKSFIFILIVFSFISIWYVIPIFNKNKRLSDYPIVKTFLIAFVWAGISTFIPLMNTELEMHIIMLIFVEKYMFIFAIAIPFEIRDITFDMKKGISTIPIIFGKTNSIVLAIFSILVAMIMVLLLYHIEVYSNKQLLALIIGYIFSIIFVVFSKNKTNDYYFTGLLDSTPIINFLLVILIV